MRIFLAQLNPIIGDLRGNTAKIIASIQAGRKKGAALVLFPELALSGYPPQDFLLLSTFMDCMSVKLEEIVAASKGISVMVGLPRRNPTKSGKELYNSAAIIENGILLGYQDKMLLPTYDVFDERRYFEPAEHMQIWKIAGQRVGVTICEDIWQNSTLNETNYQRDPVQELKVQHPDFIVNLSASPFNALKTDSRYTVCKDAASVLKCPVILCNQVGANDNLIFDGHSLFVGANGEIIQEAKGFQEDFLMIDSCDTKKHFFSPHNSTEDLYQALILGVKDYFFKSGFSQACLGLSGGVDSAVVACIAAEALGPENVIGVIMPSRYSSEGSIRDASCLARNLGISLHTIPIEAPFEAYLTLLCPEFENKPIDHTEENLQARIRGMILMALSNKHGYIVLSTGNKSEFALGYATLYGDMCGGLSVIGDLVKRDVYALAAWINRSKEIIPLDTIKKPPSAELRPNQLDSQTLPAYDIVDNVVEAYVEKLLSKEAIVEKYGYSPELVQGLIQKIHRNEYKRRQSAPGLRVSQKAFFAGRHFPIVQGFIR